MSEKSVLEKRILITGAAGFIGYHLSSVLLKNHCTVIGFDNLNDYYDVGLKMSRLDLLKENKNFTFIKGDLSEFAAVENIFEKYRPDIVVNLAAQAGVRYSIDNPRAYMESNVNGFFNILEACRNYKVEHLIFASSSSVYGNQTKVPFSIEDKVDYPISLYAATKKSNELMAYTYSHLYGIPTTGLRFFTVYGPMGRPDMAYFSFAQKILRGETIMVYNNGDMYRDFTYIDDITTGIVKIMSKPPVNEKNGDPYRIYNIGNNKPEKLMDFIHILETELGKEARKEFLPMQAGDVYQTYADISALQHDFGFTPSTTLKEGIHKFVDWFFQYYDVESFLTGRNE